MRLRLAVYNSYQNAIIPQRQKAISLAPELLQVSSFDDGLKSLLGGLCSFDQRSVMFVFLRSQERTELVAFYMLLQCRCHCGDTSYLYIYISLYIWMYAFYLHHLWRMGGEENLPFRINKVVKHYNYPSCM